MSDKLEFVAARVEIENVMAGYVRGVDHKDVDVLINCYHPDAYELHHIFNGNAHDFARWRVRQSFRSQHMLSASAIDLRGDRAFVETPHTAFVHVDIDEQGHHGVIEVATAGWYLDIFSRRQDEWKIEFQQVVTFRTSTQLVTKGGVVSMGVQSPQLDDDLFKLGFALPDKRPEPSHVDDVAAGIRMAFLSQVGAASNEA